MLIAKSQFQKNSKEFVLDKLTINSILLDKLIGMAVIPFAPVLSRKKAAHTEILDVVPMKFFALTQLTRVLMMDNCCE